MTHVATQAKAPYAGDIDSFAAYAILATDRDAVLIDIRTRAEWEFVGRPSLREISKSPLYIEWQDWPYCEIDELFAERVAAKVGKDVPVLLLCRSGQRSRDAAIELTEQGFTRCYNVVDGFEGPKNAQGQRNTVEGWRVAGLPWTQG